MISFHVLSGRECDSSPSLQISIGKDAYIFNIPPLLNQKKQCSFSKKTIKHFFATSINPEATNGHLEMVCNYSSQLNFEITCPEDFADFQLKNFDYSGFDSYSAKTTDSFSDKNINVQSIKMSKSYFYDVHIQSSERTTSFNIFQSNGVNGKDYIWELSNKGSVTLPNGITVQKSDVFITVTHKARVLICDCYDINDLQFLPTDVSNFSAIFHFTSPNLYSEVYTDFFKSNSNNFYFADSPILINLVFKDFNKFYHNSNGIITPLSFETKSINLPSHFKSLQQFENYNFVNNNFVPTQIETEYVPFQICPLPQVKTFGLTVLGTTSGKSSSSRSISGYLLHTIDGFIAIDTGEGYVERLTQKYGRENVKHILLNLNAIYISHHHFDHINGILLLLKKRSEVTNAEINVFTDDELYTDLMYKEEKFYSKGYFHMKFYDRFEPTRIKSTLIRSMKVRHRTTDSMACVFELFGGYVFAYSGDKLGRYEENLKFSNFIGNKCDLLLHECTYIDAKNHWENALKYMHSTMDDALEVANMCNAKFVLLTHFSQRYKYDEYVCERENVCFAFDYLSFEFENIENVWKLCRERQLLKPENKGVAIIYKVEK